MSTATAPSPATTAVAPLKAAKRTIQNLLEGDAFKNAVAKSLPKHLSSDRFVRVAITAMTKTPKLALCEQASFFNALLSLSQYGLEPDGRRAYLIPFNNTKRNLVECQLIIDWKGLAELAMRSGMVSKLHADVVCEGDIFEYSAGELKAHVPWFLRRDKAKPEAPGDIYAAYSLCRFKDGSEKCEVMSLSEIEGIRRRSKSPEAGPWVTDWSEMAKKTTFRRLSKWLPLSAEFRDAVELDDNHAGILTIDTTGVGKVLPAPPNTPVFTVESEPDALTEGDGTAPADDPVEVAAGLAPAPAPAPKAASPKSTAPAAGAKRPINFLTGVRGLVKIGGFPEETLVSFLHAIQKADESLVTLEEINEGAPSALQFAFDNWADVQARIKASIPAAE